MRRFIWAFVFLFAVGFVLIPGQFKNPGSIHPNEELTMKHQLMARDVDITDELCRNQCLSDFHHSLSLMQSSDPSHVRSILDEMRMHHPHMLQLIWENPAGSQQRIEVGDMTLMHLDELTRSRIIQYVQEAENSVRNGEEFQSSRIESEGRTYVVLGTPDSGSDRNKYSSIIGVIQQDILQKVTEHQVKNLRIAPYPPEHWKIQSADSVTLDPVIVDHPEDNEGTSHYHVNEIVVKFLTDPTREQLLQIQSDIQANFVRKLGYTYIFQSRDLTMDQLTNYFQNWHVEYIEPHFYYMTNREVNTIVPNDLLYEKYQWNLPIIDTEMGWNVSKGAKDIVVSIIDTGVDIHHPDLKANLLQGYNVFDDKLAPKDDVGHGTHVTGVVSAIVNNSRGVAGITWANPILPVKVLDHTGAGNTYAVAQGIIWAADHGAKVINLSLGNYAEAKFLHDAIKYAFDRDIVIVAASGNDNTEKPGYPAAYPEVLAVAATDASKNKASFSNFGDYIDVAAPGVNIASTYPDNQYASLSGTSMASPHVTALAALIRSVNPKLKNTEVMDIIRNTAEDLGPKGKDKLFGFGQIDVANALKSALNDQEIKSEVESVRPLPQWLVFLKKLFQ